MSYYSKHILKELENKKVLLNYKEIIHRHVQKLIKPRPKQRYYLSDGLLLFRHDETICSWPIDLRQHDMHYQKHLDNDDIIDFFKRIFHLKRKFETFWIGGRGGGE